MNMRIHPRYLIATVAVLLGAAGLHAQTTGTNGCNITIPPVNLLSVYGTAVLNVPTPNVGDAAGASGITDSTNVTFKLTTNQTNMKVTVAASIAAPTGVTLAVQVGTNGSSLSGTISSLTTANQYLMTGISNVATNTTDSSGIPLIYTLTLTKAATDTTTAPYSPTITYTLTNT